MRETRTTHVTTLDTLIVIIRGCYGDFEKLNTSEIDCTTTQNMCLGVQKRAQYHDPTHTWTRVTVM